MFTVLTDKYVHNADFLVKRCGACSAVKLSYRTRDFLQISNLKTSYSHISYSVY